MPAPWRRNTEAHSGPAHVDDRWARRVVDLLLASSAAGILVALSALSSVPALAQGAITPVRPDPTAWFQAPCQPDSSDDFGWTRHDLHGIRIRVPPGVRRVSVPNVDELHFRAGRATMRLRLHRDASELFTHYYRPDLTYKYCTDDIGGLLAEAVSFRQGIGFYGFAARWPDAERGEWLTVVIQGRTLDEVSWLRRALFTIVFPDERHR